MRQFSNRVAISITDGRSVRDLFYNGLLNYFNEAGFSVTVFTEAISVPHFVKEWQRPGVEFATLSPCEPTSTRNRAFWMRRSIARAARQPVALAGMAGVRMAPVLPVARRICRALPARSPRATSYDAFACAPRGRAAACCPFTRHSDTRCRT